MERDMRETCKFFSFVVGSPSLYITSNEYLFSEFLFCNINELAWCAF